MLPQQINFKKRIHVNIGKVQGKRENWTSKLLFSLEITGSSSSSSNNNNNSNYHVVGYCYGPGM